MKNLLKLALLSSFFLANAAQADSTKARCDIYPKGSDQASGSFACTFAQRQGNISIYRSDGVEYQLTPADDKPGRYLDQDGKSAYRQSELGDSGLIFRLAKESVYVFWDPYPFSQDPEANTENKNNGFDQTLTLQDISFRVSSANDSSLNTVHIQPSGLKSDNELITAEIDGTITAAEISDLDNNGYPEIYIYVSSAGSGSYASLLAYAVNKGKSITPIYIAPISDDPVNSIGYMGHDEFRIVELNLIRRFPIYLEGDSNANPSGKTRQLQYKLVAGEAGWVLEFDLAIEY